MATVAGKAQCSVCEKERCRVTCDGCTKSFCLKHFEDHRQELNKQLDEVEVSRNLVRQMLTEQTTQLEEHALIQEVDQWERDSVNKIRQVAEEARRLLLKEINIHFNDTEVKLKDLTTQIRKGRDENDFFEIDLQQWEKQLIRLKEELNKPPAITIIHDSTSLVNSIYVDTSPQSCIQNIPVNTRWFQNGATIIGNNIWGSELNQLRDPYGLYVDYHQTVYIADKGNHRIMEWKSGATTGQVVVGGNGYGSQNNQLHHPTDVFIDKGSNSLIICDRGNKRVVRWPRRNGTNGETLVSNIDCYGLTMDNYGYLYVSDYSKHEVKRWRLEDNSETLVAGGNGKGDRLDQLNGPTYIVVDQDQSVYVSDSDNHRVIKWIENAKEGIVVAGGNGRGNSLMQLFNPGGIAVDQLGTVYVTDFKNDRVMSWPRGATEGSVVVGGQGSGQASNKFKGPWDLSFDQQNNLYVVDHWNHRVQKFHKI